MFPYFLCFSIENLQLLGGIYLGCLLKMNLVSEILHLEAQYVHYAVYYNKLYLPLIRDVNNPNLQNKNMTKL